ncbi:hypothetical protein ACMXYR_08680 [Neptuniibacter sp. QD29_5]|uniref:hypothetical protein n=1 Tax=Neptuniibacter sp. QD29_5 TaxID=3398207 RepID=UPI0039F51685
MNRHLLWPAPKVLDDFILLQSSNIGGEEDNGFIQEQLMFLHPLSGFEFLSKSSNRRTLPA